MNRRVLLGGFAVVLAAVSGLGLHRALRARNELGIRTVVLVTVDGLRADRLAPEAGPAKDPAGALARLAAEAVVFERCLTTAPLSLPAHVSLHCGTDPLVHGVRDDAVPDRPPDLPTLADVLGEAGFRTAGFVSHARLGRPSGLARGFEHFDERFARADGTFDPDPGSRRGLATVERLLAHLETLGDAPAFTWVHLAEPLLGLPPEERLDRVVYAARLVALDAAVLRLREGLGRLGRSGETLLVLAGSHGLALGEHGVTGHGLSLHDPALAVPLLFHAPGRLPAGRRVRGTVSLASLAPTLVRLLDRDVPATMTASSAADAVRGPGEPVAPPDSVRFECLAPRSRCGLAPASGVEHAGDKLVLGAWAALYRPAADPLELHDLAPAEPARVGALVTVLRRHERRAAGILFDGGGGGDALEIPLGAGGEPFAAASALADAERACARGTPPPIAELEALAAALPQAPLARLLLARARLTAGDAQAALAAFRETLALQPEMREAQLGEAHAWRALGDEAAARRVLEQTVAHAPGDLEARKALAELRRDEGLPHEAVALLDEVVRRAPLDGAARRLRADCLTRLGNVRLAELDLRAAHEARPRDAQVLAELAECNRLLANEEEERFLLKRLLELEPRGEHAGAAAARLAELDY